jgi:hypothetical protein
VGFVGLLWLTLVVLVYTFCVLKGANKILLTYQIFFFFFIILAAVGLHKSY